MVSGMPLSTQELGKLEHFSGQPVVHFTPAKVWSSGSRLSYQSSCHSSPCSRDFETNSQIIELPQPIAGADLRFCRMWYSFPDSVTTATNISSYLTNRTEDDINTQVDMGMRSKVYIDNVSFMSHESDVNTSLANATAQLNTSRSDFQTAAQTEQSSRNLSQRANATAPQTADIAGRSQQVRMDANAVKNLSTNAQQQRGQAEVSLRHAGVLAMFVFLLD